MIGKDKSRGTWYAQIYFVDLEGKGHYKKKRGFSTKKEAQLYEAQMKLDNDVHSCSYTFKDMWHLSEVDSSAETKKQHAEHFNIRFSKFLNKRIDKITRHDLMQWRSDLYNSKFSTATKNTTIMYVRGVFEYANDVYGLPNTATCLKSFKKTNEELMREMQVWTVEEFRQFIGCVDSPIYRDFFHALFWTGMRRGECIALQCDDYEDGWINIHASQEYASEGLKPTKTRTRRRIQVDDVTAKILEKRKSESEHGYLFGGNYCLTPTPIDRHFKKAIQDAGVKPIRLHDLRHSHATLLINQGVNIVAVSKRLGHGDIETTLKHYTHLLADTDSEMMNIINSNAKKKQKKK